MKQELFQSHCDHIGAIMPPEQFIQRLQDIINASKPGPKGMTHVTLEEMTDVNTEVMGLIYGEGPMQVDTIMAFSPKDKIYMVGTFYPAMDGVEVKAQIVDILEWDNQMEATIVCQAGDFKFAFFATDYYLKKTTYHSALEQGARSVTVKLAALGCKVEAAERGFSFEGQQAVDWLAKLGKRPTYDAQGNVQPVRFNTTNLVAFLNTESRCPDEAEFQSPAGPVSRTTLLDVDFFRTDICISKRDDVPPIHVPLYFRRDFLPDVREGDPIRGWLWLTGQLADTAAAEGTMPDDDRATDTNALGDIGLKFVAAIDSFNFKRFDDIMPIVDVLDQIRVDQGYVVDAFQVGDRHAARLQLYACKRDATERYAPVRHMEPVYKTRRKWFKTEKIKIGERMVPPEPYNDELYISGLLGHELAQTVPPVFTHLKVPFTEAGIWQAFLLHIAPSMMPFVWHAGYGARDYIFSLELLQYLKADCSAYFHDRSLLPSVRLTEDGRATVTCSYWNNWRGLCRSTVTVDKDMHFGQPDTEVLVKYNCGIIF